MELRDLAAAELSALRRSTSDRADQAHRDFETARRAFDTAIAARDQALAAAVPSEDAVSAIVERLSSASAAEIQAAIERVRTESQAALDQTMAAQRAESQAALDGAVAAARAESQATLEQAVSAVRAESQAALDTALAAARAESQHAHDKALEAAQAEFTAQLHDAQQQSASLEQRLKETSAAAAFGDAVRREAEAARDKETLLRTTTEGELAKANQQLKAAEQDLSATREQLTAARNELEQTVRGLAAARDAAASAAAAADARIADLERALAEAETVRIEQGRTLRAQTVKVALQPLEHLRSAFHRLTTARTIDDVLGVLLEALGTEFSRAAIFDVTANRIEGRRHIGFDAEGGIAKIVIPLTVDSPLTAAVRTGRVQGLPARELGDPAHALFGGEPTFVLALPVAVRGQVIAVLYGDDSEQADTEFITPERRVKFAEALLWHAIPLLTKLSIEEEALAEIREYAVSVLKDLESVHTADAAAHKPAEVRARLGRNLEYARQRFAERVESEGPTAQGLFNEEIARIMNAKPPTPFGRDLADVSGLRAQAKGGAKQSGVASQRA